MRMRRSFRTGDFQQHHKYTRLCVSQPTPGHRIPTDPKLSITYTRKNKTPSCPKPLKSIRSLRCYVFSHSGDFIPQHRCPVAADMWHWNTVDRENNKNIRAFICSPRSSCCLKRPKYLTCICRYSCCRSGTSTIKIVVL